MNEHHNEERKTNFIPVKKINIVNEFFPKEYQKKIREEAKIIYYTLMARELSNLRANEGTPDFFLQKCIDFAQKYKEKVQIQFLKGEDVLKNGLRLMHAVGRGSCNPPIAINLTYKGAANAFTNQNTTIALIGKGLCFDAGGLNLKPTNFIENMYMDKSGACNIFCAFCAAVELNLKVNLSCSLGFVENLVSSKSYCPSDIIKSLKGLTVEIGNTDAEGRLVLSDLMTWTQTMIQKQFPQYKSQVELIEYSTLTGACVVALGETTAGLFSNDEQLATDFLNSSFEENESIWRLPITKEHRKNIKSDVADISNSGKSRYGGASKAAAFLEHFVEKNTKWIHLDIAGPAEYKKPTGVYSFGCSGFGVQTLVNYLKKKQK